MRDLVVSCLLVLVLAPAARADGPRLGPVVGGEVGFGGGSIRDRGTSASDGGPRIAGWLGVTIDARYAVLAFVDDESFAAGTESSWGAAVRAWPARRIYVEARGGADTQVKDAVDSTFSGGRVINGAPGGSWDGWIVGATVGVEIVHTDLIRIDLRASADHGHAGPERSNVAYASVALGFY